MHRFPGHSLAIRPYRLSLLAGSLDCIQCPHKGVVRLCWLGKSALSTGDSRLWDRLCFTSMFVLLRWFVWWEVRGCTIVVFVDCCFSRVYSNFCCSCSFEREIINISQSSHKMYSNNIVNFQESTTIVRTTYISSSKIIVCIIWYLCNLVFIWCSHLVYIVFVECIALAFFRIHKLHPLQGGKNSPTQKKMSASGGEIRALELYKVYSIPS